MVDKSKIKVGDQVKIRYYGLVSEDWQTVLKDPWGDLYLDGYFYLNATSHITILEHKPDLSSYEKAVESAKAKIEAANSELVKAEKALAEAKNVGNLRYAHGIKIKYVNHKGDVNIGVVEPAPKGYDWFDSEDLIWARWEHSPHSVLYVNQKNFSVEEVK